MLRELTKRLRTGGLKLTGGAAAWQALTGRRQVTGHAKSEVYQLNRGQPDMDAGKLAQLILGFAVKLAKCSRRFLRPFSAQSRHAGYLARTGPLNLTNTF